MSNPFRTQRSALSSTSHYDENQVSDTTYYGHQPSTSNSNSMRNQTLPLPNSIAQAHGMGERSRSTGATNSKIKKKSGRGRHMMVKVFYSLSSPRFPSPSPATSPPARQSQQQQQNPQPFASTSAFLAVLDPSLAPPPQANFRIEPPSPPPTDPVQAQTSAKQNYTCIARLSAPVWVQLIGREATGSGRIEYGKVTLKTCLSAICISRPELVTDSTKDYAISAVDPYESSLQPASSLPSSINSNEAGGHGLMEGKGMLSWNLAEKREGTTWVCGRVIGENNEERAQKRRRVDGGYVDESEVGDDEEEGSGETLEVWLQLVEGPSFTQNQFLTSLRSFAKPAPTTLSSDRGSSPPPSRCTQQSLAQSSRLSHSQSQSHLSNQPQQLVQAVASVGDPIKKKRPRAESRATSNSHFNTSLPTPAPTSSSIPAAPLSLPSDPQVLGLLTQLFPALAGGIPNTNPSVTLPPSFSLDSPQGRALLPAIQTLAKFYGVSIPGLDGGESEGPVPSTSTSHTVSFAPEARSKGKGKELNSRRASEGGGEFLPLPQEKKDAHTKGAIFNPLHESGCMNCKRRKSATWRARKERNGRTVSVCNPCGVYHNKHGHHRTKGDRDTSPPPQRPSSPVKSTGRPLQGRLTATCETELLRKASLRSRRAGFIPPASPSKHIGPNRSPSAIFKHGGLNHNRSLQSGGSPFALTSPVRSPRHRAMRGIGAGGSTNFSNMMAAMGGGRASGAMSSPVRGSAAATFGDGVGLKSGYVSGAGPLGGPTFDFTTLYGGQKSPSPIKPLMGGGHVPEYLLTASPGTALKRILSDTNIDLNSFDMMDPGSTGLLGSDAADDFGFYLRSTPDGKENEPPVNTPTFAFNNDQRQTSDQLHSLPTTDAEHGQSTDYFDSILSSLRRDFDTRLPTDATNGATSPCSPTPSSPCVQPRTSSATPGQKSKQPASCGRPAPSILDSFMDDLVPAFALNDNYGQDENTPTESEGWTPNTDGTNGETDLDRLLAQGGPEEGTYNLNHLLRSNKLTGRSYLPSHLLGDLATSSSSVGSDGYQAQTQQDQRSPFDFGSLPPSSPPALPSEMLLTPSEFDAGVTPDGDGSELNDSRTVNDTLSYGELSGQPRSVRSSPAKEGGGDLAALLQSFGAKGGEEKVEMTVTQLLAIIAAQNGAVVSGNKAEVVVNHEKLYDNLLG